ncbi:MAG TPA: hypothetical protein VGE07_13980 [Herpetosiphonaceae bacterium]
MRRTPSLLCAAALAALTACGPSAADSTSSSPPSPTISAHASATITPTRRPPDGTPPATATPTPIPDYRATDFPADLPPPRELAPERLIAATYGESTSWIDTGLRGIVFGDGSGYSLEPHPMDEGAAAAPPRIIAFQLGEDELAALVGAFEQNRFFLLDERMSNPIPDGSESSLSYAEPGAHHSSALYMAWSAPFVAIETHFSELLTRQRATGRRITVDELLAAAQAHLARLPAGSEERERIFAAYDDWFRYSDILGQFDEKAARWPGLAAPTPTPR